MALNKTETRLVRLALRELGSNAYLNDITKWISSEYKRIYVSNKKARLILKKCEDVTVKKEKGDYLFSYREPKIRTKDVISFGIRKYKTRENFSRNLGISSSILSEWISGVSHPSEESLKKIDDFADRHGLV